MRILAVSGSLRGASFNTRLLRAAAEAAPEGVEVELFDPAGIADLPLYDQDLEDAGAPEPVERLRAEWGDADAILFSTPEYNGSVPGGLKNAIDWASRPARESALTNKTVAVVGASPGRFGAMWAQADLRKILGIAGARVVGDELPVARVRERFDDEGLLLDGELLGRLRLTLLTLASEAVPARNGARAAA
jgi:chromate reductase